MGTFAFLVHPLNMEDVAKKYRLAKKLSPRVVASVLKRRRSFVLSEPSEIKSKNGASAQGWFVVVPLLPWQFYELDEDFVIGKISQACQVAHKQGADIVGLGAFTKTVGRGGKTVASQVAVPVTTGNTYTVYLALEGTRLGARLMGVDLKQAQVAIVGASGSIGRACAQILSEEVGELHLVGRDLKKLQEVADEVSNGSAPVRVTRHLTRALQGAEIVITVTSSTEAIINPSDLRSGAVVCDVARPRDVSQAVAEVRNDVLVIDGGIARMPGRVDLRFDFGLPVGTALGCMAETMVLALENRFECFSLGRNITGEKVKEIRRLAEKHGFSLAGLRSFDRLMNDDQVAQIRERASLFLK